MPEIGMPIAGVPESYGAVGGASSLATLVTAGGSPHTPGSWVSLGTIGRDAAWLIVQLTGVSAAAHYMVDIGVGASSSDAQVIVSSLHARQRGATGGAGTYLIPVSIARGQQLWARAQCATASATIRVSAETIPGGPGMTALDQRAIHYGDASASTGVLVDPGGTANTWSSWVEIADATASEHSWLVIYGPLGDPSVNAAISWRLQIGIGAAGDEEPLIELHASCDNQGRVPHQLPASVPCLIPRGARLAARLRSSSTNAAGRVGYVNILGCG